MIIDQRMLREPAEAAGIKVPTTTRYKRSLYPHWHVYVIMQLERPMPRPDAHWHNAKIIASVKAPKILRITGQELASLGFV